MTKRKSNRPKKYEPKISLKEDVTFQDLISLSLGKKETPKEKAPTKAKRNNKRNKK